MMVKGAGGTISKLIEIGANVYYFAFSIAEQSVPDGFPKDILKNWRKLLDRSKFRYYLENKNWK